MSTYTPGPWFIFGNDCCVGGPHGENGTAGVAMCGMRLRTPEEAAANARLIAVAPDLLSTLKAILANDGSDGRFDAIENYKAHEAARMVIAKAEGLSN